RIPVPHGGPRCDRAPRTADRTSQRLRPGPARNQDLSSPRPDHRTGCRPRASPRTSLLIGPVQGAILAGGQASRLGGRPKGLIEIGGRRMLDRIADLLTEVTGTPPCLIANAPDAATWRRGLAVIPD